MSNAEADSEEKHNNFARILRFFTSEASRRILPPSCDNPQLIPTDYFVAFGEFRGFHNSLPSGRNGRFGSLETLELIFPILFAKLKATVAPNGESPSLTSSAEFI